MRRTRESQKRLQSFFQHGAYETSEWEEFLQAIDGREAILDKSS